MWVRGKCECEIHGSYIPLDQTASQSETLLKLESEVWTGDKSIKLPYGILVQSVF